MNRENYAYSLGEEDEGRDKKSFILLLLLFGASSLLNFTAYSFPMLMRNPLLFNLTSFYFYFVILIRIILPLFGIVLALEGKKSGWLIVVFLVSYSVANFLLQHVKMIYYGQGIFSGLFGIGTITFILSIVILVFLFNRKIRQPGAPSNQSRLASLAAGVIVAILFHVQSLLFGR